MANLQQNSVNFHSMCKLLHILCKVYTTLYKSNWSLHMLCKRFAKKNTHVHKFHAPNVMWTRRVILALGKLGSSSWCYLKIYTADKKFTWPPVAPNINSERSPMYSFCTFMLLPMSDISPYMFPYNSCHVFLKTF